MTYPLPYLQDLFRPTRSRGFCAIAVAAIAFLLPQEAPLVFYPLNSPSRGILQLQITCAATVTGTTKFHLDSGSGFNDVEVISWPIAPSSQPYTYTFPLPDAPLLGLRLDPFDSGSGEFTITNWRIIERKGGEVRRFTADDLRQLRQIKDVVPVPGGWKLVAGGDNPSACVDFPAPLVPSGMNLRNFQRCLLSWGYLALMLWILLLAVYVVLVHGRPSNLGPAFEASAPRSGGRQQADSASTAEPNLKENAAAVIFLAGIALLFALVGNRGLIKDSIHSAHFRPPLPAARTTPAPAPGTTRSPGLPG